MEQREFIVWFDKYDWEIRLSGVDDYHQYAEHNEYLGFAICKVKDKKVIYLAADCVSDDMIKNDNELLKEQCKFTHNSVEFMDSVPEPNRKSFTGSFIDALGYIKKGDE